MIRSLLVDVAIMDVATLAVVSLTLTLVAVAATIVPAGRALAVNSTDALRRG